MPLSTGSRSATAVARAFQAARAVARLKASRSGSGGDVVGDSSAAAAIVATRARSGVTSPLPSGWTRFDRKIT